MIVKIVMCEGPHDTAFVSRVLRVMGCGNDKTRIGEFPDYLTKFLKKQFICCEGLLTVLNYKRDST